MLLCAPEKRFTQTHSRVCYFKINRSVREAEARVLIQALCRFAERGRIFFMYGFQSQACVHPASVDYTKCAVSGTANILLLLQRSVLSSVDMIYHLFSAPFKEQLPNQIQEIEFEQDAPTKK